MNSLKTTIVCVVLLGVLYGMYQVINTPTPTLMDDSAIQISDLGEPVNPQMLLEMGTDGYDGQTEMLQGSGGNESSPAQQGSISPPSLRGGPSERLSQGPSYGANGGAQLEERAPRIDGAGRGALANRFQPDAGSTLDGDDSDRGYANREYANREYANGATENRADGTSTPGTDLLNRSALSADSALVSAAASTPRMDIRELPDAWNKANSQVERGEYMEALATLTPFYDATELSTEERNNLQIWLDALAGKVIYSTEHLLFVPYLVESGDTIERIAARFEIPAELLRNINRERLGGSQPLPGTELKVVPGPFRAVVNLPQETLTLYLGNLYAGHFPIVAGTAADSLSGTFRVAQKSDNGRSVPGGDSPYGQYLLDLGRGIVIHEITDNPAAQSASCIGLRVGDARDVYGILGRDSEVEILR